MLRWKAHCAVVSKPGYGDRFVRMSEDPWLADLPQASQPLLLQGVEDGEIGSVAAQGDDSADARRGGEIEMARDRLGRIYMKQE